MNKRKSSISTRAVITTVLAMALLTLCISAVGYTLYVNSVIENNTEYAETILDYAYRAADRHSFGDMIAARSMPEEYEILRGELNEVKDCSTVEYLYAIYFEDIEDIYSIHYAINAKTEEELNSGIPIEELYSYMGRPCSEGDFAEDTRRTLQDAVKNPTGKAGVLEGYSEEYGHMLNGYRTLFDTDGNAVGLMCVEIDINRINMTLSFYIRTVILIAAILTAIVIAVYYANMRKKLIEPIQRIAASSDDFVKKMEANTDPEELTYQEPVIDSGEELHQLSDNVKSLADGVSSYMRNLKNVMAERERIGAELDVAKEIQMGMLPRNFPPYPERTEFDLYALADPAKEVGGDFFDFFMPDDDHIVLVIADVSGKGVPAAMFMSISKLLINIRTRNDYSSPAKILSYVNDLLSEENELDMFVTVWLAVIDLTTGKGIAANAGHEHPALRHKDGTFELVKYRHSPAIASFPGISFSEHEFTLEEGDTLFVYTDGVPEATSEDLQLFGTDRMLDVLNREPDADPEKLIENVLDGIADFVQEAEQFDDITMLTFRFNRKAKS